MEFYVVCTEKCICKLESNNVSYRLVFESFFFCFLFSFFVANIWYSISVLAFEKGNVEDRKSVV